MASRGGNLLGATHVAPARPVGGGGGAPPGRWNDVAGGAVNGRGNASLGWPISGPHGSMMAAWGDPTDETARRESGRHGVARRWWHPTLPNPDDPRHVSISHGAHLVPTIIT